MSARRDPDALDLEFPRGKPLGPGPVYQGVAKQIREMIEAQLIDRELDAGTIAAARSCARSVDTLAGHNERGQIAAGMQQAAMHAQLLAWLDKLGGREGADDPFTKFLEDLNDSPTQAPHPEV